VPLNSLFMGLEVRRSNIHCFFALLPFHSRSPLAQLINSDRSDIQRRLPASADELVTLKLCGSAAEALMAVLSDVLDLRQV
jgi:hypothetical protein